MIVKIKDIKIDHINPRYPHSKNEQSQIESMIDHDGQKILFLMRDILDVGLSPLSNIGIIEENSNLIVVDGNRRVAALKIFLGEFDSYIKKNNPGLYSHIEMERKLHNNKLSFYKTIEVTRIKDRNAANQWVRRIHVVNEHGAHTLTWETYARRRFDHNILKQQNRVITIIDKAISEKILTDAVYYDIKKFSTLERLFDDPAVIKWIAFDFNKVTFTNKRKINRIKLLVNKIISGIIIQDIYSKKHRKEFIEKLEIENKIKPEINEITIKLNKVKTPKSRKANISFELKGLNKEDLAGLNNELKEIKIEKSPRVGIAGLRMMLELRVNWFINKHGIVKKSASLAEKLKACLSYAKDNNLAETSVIEKVVDLTEEHSYKSTLDDIIHKSNIVPQKKDILTLIDITKKIINILTNN